MKLRIKGNTLRVRLSQSEVIELDEKGLVKDQIQFGLTSLSYSIVSDVLVDHQVRYENNAIEIIVPNEEVNNWAKTDQVGFDFTMNWKGQNVIHVLIEKDFKCLTDRPNEDESDLFENPMQGHTC